MRIDNPQIKQNLSQTNSGLRKSITKVTQNGFGEQLWIADGRLYCSKGSHGTVNMTAVMTATGYAPSNFRRGLELMWEVPFPPTETGNLVDADVYGTSAWALFDNGNLYTWGENADGQLGVGDTTDRYVPTLSNTGVTKVYSHVSNSQRSTRYQRLFMLKDGELYGCGYNNWYQVGDGTQTNRLSWTKITAAGTNPKSVWNMGGYTGCLVVQKSDNKILICGYNGYGQLGNNTTNTITSLTDLSSVWNGGDNTMVIQDVQGGFSFFNGSTNESCNLIMFMDNGTSSRIASCGANSWSALGDGTTTDRRVPVVPTGLTGRIRKIVRSGDVLGAFYVLKTDGTLWDWGYNDQGQLGRGNTTTTGTPAQVMTGVEDIQLHFCAGAEYGYRVQSPVVKKTDGTYWICGQNQFGQCANGDSSTIQNTFRQMWFPTGTVIKHFGTHNTTSHGDTHFAVTDNDEIYAYGYNTYASISNEHNEHFYLPTIMHPPVLQR